MNLLDQHLTDKLQERQKAGNLRKLCTERAAIDFFSNDYLGIATSGLLQDIVGGNTYASGSTGSRLLSGNTQEAEALEQAIARFHKAEAALLFNSGYDANVGLLNSICDRHTTILYDELCHASIIDGIRLSQATNRYKFRHNDLQQLKEKLQRAGSDHPIVIVVESVYSMDGDIAPLEGLCKLAEKYSAAFIVDEAHATGVFGMHGEGLVCSLNLQNSVYARIHTFGKALGCHGAAVAGSRLLIDYLVNFARSFIYTTALPMHTIKTIGAAYSYLQSPDFSNRRLHELINYFRAQIQQYGQAGWKDSHSPIQALVIGSNEKTKKVAHALQKAGLQINPILHPTVSLGMERLRICLHAFNKEAEIDTLMEVLKEEL
ncbi:MAG: aminotransferase class I/II-fold pyridoxal phosphate-dependent enzyme [Flavipsychrobacter sp.]